LFPQRLVSAATCFRSDLFPQRLVSAATIVDKRYQFPRKIPTARAIKLRRQLTQSLQAPALLLESIWNTSPASL